MDLKLTQDEALVFFEWLSRVSNQDAFPLKDEAEEHVLWSLLCKLERVMVEPFQADYLQLVEQARERIRAQNSG